MPSLTPGQVDAVDVVVGALFRGEVLLDPRQTQLDSSGVEALEVPGLEVEKVLEPGGVFVDLLDERQASGSESPSSPVPPSWASLVHLWPASGSSSSVLTHSPQSGHWPS
jgi:hypothetical protein